MDVYTNAVLRTTVLSQPDSFVDLKDEWRDLQASAQTATPFQTWEWQSTWWEHFGRRKKPHIIAVREGEDLVGLVPMVEGRGLWNTLRPSGIGPSDYLHPLARTGCEQAVAEAAVRHFATLENIDLIDLHQIRESRDLAAAIQEPSIEQAMCLVLDLPQTFDAYLALLSKSLRYDVRKLDKSLFKEGRAKLLRFGPEDVQQGMDVFFEQHKLRWRKRGMPGAFLGRSVAFHRQWANVAAENGMLWLSVLTLDDAPIGAIYAMAMGETCYFYQAGFDPSKGSVSPGTLLVAATIRRAIEEGKQHFDFMRGDEPYKRRWKPQHALRNLRFVIPGHGNARRLASSWNVFGSRVEGKLRARLEGRGLL